MNLEIPKSMQNLVDGAYALAKTTFRPISRKYDELEHTYPKELDLFAAIINGANDGSGGAIGGAKGDKKEKTASAGVRNGGNMANVLNIQAMCYGDVGLLLAIPRQGLGNAAIAAVANEEQSKRFEKIWAAMAITEPGCGSDSAAIRTTAVKDGDEYILNGEKIYITSGERADAIVVWATLDKNLGRAAIKSFVVEKGTPGMELIRTERKLGIQSQRYRSHCIYRLSGTG
jgi:acyl-CoA dehydrogenase